MLKLSVGHRRFWWDVCGSTRSGDVGRIMITENELKRLCCSKYSFYDVVLCSRSYAECFSSIDHDRLLYVAIMLEEALKQIDGMLEVIRSTGLSDTVHAQLRIS
jgi:hypothetical protein